MDVKIRVANTCEIEKTCLRCGEGGPDGTRVRSEVRTCWEQSPDPEQLGPN